MLKHKRATKSSNVLKYLLLMKYLIALKSENKTPDDAPNARHAIKV